MSQPTEKLQEIHKPPVGMPGNLEILIIDDDKTFVLMHKRMLELSGIKGTTRTFPDGSKTYEFLKKNESTEGLYYLMLLDINMPNMNGWALLDRIQKLKLANRVFAVILTSSVDQNDRARAQNFSQVIGFISKPLTINHLDQLRQLETMKPFLL